jgi:hypothetical protein
MSYTTFTLYAGIPMPLRRELNTEFKIYTIIPYWDEDTWVFDDPAVGLVKEPFVRGASEMITAMLGVSNVTNAKAGFCMTFTNAGGGFRLERREPADGGWYYYCPQIKMEGWLCPALYLYFEEAPVRLSCTMRNWDMKYRLPTEDNMGAPGASKDYKPTIHLVPNSYNRELKFADCVE